jgi:transcriptional regulator with XRE-family HTH domain
MDIGTKLKNARVRNVMTQEKVAEEIGVSRQTISNWENSKSYPDIISVINLSDLYSVSLDELLKGDSNMVEFLDESTNNVKSRQGFSKLIQVMVYLIIWATCIVVFWIGGRADAIGYTLVVLYLILPVTTLTISFFIGKDNGWANYKWLMLLFFGLMYMLAPYATFSLANTVTFGNINMPEITTVLPGILCSAAGMLIGTIIKAIKAKKSH